MAEEQTIPIQENKERKDRGPRLDIIRIASYHCWKCGHLFEKEGDFQESEHHGIPVFFRPKRNIKMPICMKCHREINSYFVQAIPKRDPKLNVVITKIKTIKANQERALKKTTKTLDELVEINNKGKPIIPNAK